MKLKLPNVRLSFPDLFEATAFKPGDVPRFKATFLLPKNSPQVKEVEAAILAAATEKWGAKAAAVIKGIRNNPNKFCFQDGDTKEYDGYAGMMALSARNSVRPLVLDADKTPLSASDGKPYAGCYVNGIVEFFGYDNSGNGISASVSGVQFFRDGDAFAAGRAASAEDFDAVAEGSDAEDIC